MTSSVSGLVGYVLRRASSAMMEEVAQRMGTLGLRPSEGTVLMMIGETPGITQAELGRVLAIQRANMVPIIARLEARRLVRRSRTDGRSYGLALTDDGTTLADAARQVSLAHDAEMLNAVPAEHRAHLLPALLAILQADQSSSGQ